MAVTTTSTTSTSTSRRHVSTHTAVFSDAVSNESDVVKVDLLTLQADRHGTSPTKAGLVCVQYDVSVGEVHVIFDRTANEKVLVLSGQGEYKFDSPLYPAAGGSTGDILFTTTGTDTASTYTVTLDVRLSA